MKVDKTKILILERSDEPFVERVEAGKLLGRAFEKIIQGSVVVLGIPRGGVVVAQALARELGAQLDIVLSRKIGAPGNPEFAVGAISEDGHLYLNQEYARRAGADEAYIEEEKKRQIAEIKRRAALFRKVHPKIPLKDRTVIVTDDGVATGATFEAALWSARCEKPCKLIAAIPVGPEDTLQRLSKHADELVCLRMPETFYALSRFYSHFEQVEDDHVLEILRTHNPTPHK
ncbi:MAG: phosphoribosyltransferase [Candidatus Omnitrophica bacterium]|nr:phosphoribosyltransferase [Candidatus Omnitrophota bacterium]